MGEILSIAGKDLRLLLRDKAGLFFTLILPLMYAVFFGLVTSGFSSAPSPIDILVIDEDQTPASARFVASLKEGQDFRVFEGTAQQPLTRERAADLVRSGNRAAFVVLPAGFGAASERMFWGDPMMLVVGVDPSRAAEAGMIQGLLTERAYRRMQSLFADPAAMQKMSQDSLDAMTADPEMPAAVKAVLTPFLSSLARLGQDLPAVQAAEGDAPGGGFQPVKIETVSIARERTNTYATSFPQGILWGMMGAAAGFGISLVVERARGTLLRLRASPVTPWKILAGKGLACFGTIVTLAAVLLVIARLVFDVRPTSVPLLAVAIVCCGIAFVGVMMLLSMFKSEAAAGGAGWAILLVLAMVGGGMIPLRFLPRAMAPISNLSPVRWAIEAIEGGLWRDLSPAQMLLPCSVLLGVGIGGFLLGALAFRWSAE